MGVLGVCCQTALNGELGSPAMASTNKSLSSLVELVGCTTCGLSSEVGSSGGLGLIDNGSDQEVR